MKTEDFKALGLDEETAKKCAAASAEELKGFIPKARFDEVNNEKKNLEATVSERDKQLNDLKKSSGDNAELQKQIEALQKQNAEQIKQHNAEVHTLKVNAAVDSALSSAKARNLTAVKALLKDIDKAELDENGAVKGLSEQIAALQKSDSYLFDSSKPKLKGAMPGETGNEDGDKKVDVSKMTYSEMAAYMAEHPDAKIND